MTGVFKSLFETIGKEQLLEIVEKQELSALCFDAIQQDKSLSTKVASNPEAKQRMYQMLGISIYMERQYSHYENAVKSLSVFARDNNLRMLVLKGYGLSLNYPIPAHRPCGDIDVYVISSFDDFCNCNYKMLDMAVSEKLGVEVDEGNAHHSCFEFNGFLVENHKTVLDPNRHKENKGLNQLLREEANKGIREVNGVLLPSARFYSIHLLAHMASDFTSTGTNLKRLLDWATFVDYTRKEDTVDWDFVFSTADHYGMLPFLNAINDICVRYLGYNRALFPIRIQMGMEQSFRKQSDNVFADLIKDHLQILYPPETNFIYYCWMKGNRFFKNRWKYDMVYKENFWKSLLRQGWRHLRR